MLVRLLILSFLYTACNSDKKSYSTNAENLQKRLQEMLDIEATRYNTSIQIAFTLNTGKTITVASGVNDHATQSKITPDLLVPVGSVTKGLSAVGTMRLVEQGILTLDTKASEILDPWLRENYKMTFTDHFIKPEHAWVKNITVRDFLGMTSGLGDYDDPKLQAWTYSHPDEDWTPINLLQNVSRYLYFKPGSVNGSYSSTGYNMLGMMWAAVLGHKTWDELDVKSVMVPKKEDYPLWDIATKGRCDQQEPDVAHQYAVGGKQVLPGLVELFWHDIFDYSCLNAWTAGGLQTTAAGLSDFWFNVFGTNKILTKESVAKLFDWHEVSIGTFKVQYGLGVFPTNYITGKADLNDDYTLVGHAGQDWGSTGTGGYNFARNYSFAKTGNVGTGGMNCSLSNFMDNFQADSKVVCKSMEIFTQESWDPNANFYCDQRKLGQEPPLLQKKYGANVRYMCRDKPKH